jgi:hypothetical protein
MLHWIFHILKLHYICLYDKKSNELEKNKIDILSKLSAIEYTVRYEGNSKMQNVPRAFIENQIGDQ